MARLFTARQKIKAQQTKSTAQAGSQLTYLDHTKSAYFDLRIALNQRLNWVRPAEYNMTYILPTSRHHCTWRTGDLLWIQEQPRHTCPHYSCVQPGLPVSLDQSLWSSGFCSAGHHQLLIRRPGLKNDTTTVNQPASQLASQLVN